MTATGPPIANDAARFASVSFRSSSDWPDGDDPRARRPSAPARALVPSMPGTRRSTTDLLAGRRAAQLAGLSAWPWTPPVPAITLPSGRRSCAKPSSLSPDAPAAGRAGGEDGGRPARRGRRSRSRRGRPSAAGRRTDAAPASTSTIASAKARGQPDADRQRGSRRRRPCAAGSPRPRTVSIETDPERPVDLLAQVAHVHLDHVRALRVAEVPGRLEQLALA